MRVLAGNTYPQTNGRVSPPPERLHLINGRPETISLQYPTGKPVNSRFTGQQMMYTLSDGRKAYFDPEVAAQIDALRLAPHQPFIICRLNNREWDVSYAHPPQDAPAAPPPAPRPQPAPRPAPQPSRPPAAQSGSYNGNGENTAAIMERCYSSAIEIAAGAMESARSRGLHITASFEDVRCIAATLLINETGGRK